MIPANLIAKKRDGKNLSKDEITWFITNYVSGEISEEQMASLLMAILFQGMNEIETFTMVEVMIDSGSKLDFSDSNYYVADKHSTGGIGDKVSLILAPLMAAAGLQIPMIAGRGLSFTGGTIDKLESIPDIEYDFVIINNEFEKAVSQIRSILFSERLRRYRQLNLNKLIDNLK